MKHTLLLFLIVGALFGSDFATAVSLTGTGTFNSSTGVGMQFVNTTGTTIRITELGRWVVSGNSQSHTLGIYTTNNTSSLVASVSVNTAGQPANAFTYGTLSSHYDVAAGATIYIISSENSGGDLWVGGNPNYPSLTTPGIGATQSAGLSGSSINVFGNFGNTYSSFGPVTFRFTSPDVPGWTKDGTTYTTNGYPYAVNSAITDADGGDRINIPAGTFTYGSSGIGITINKAVSVRGAGSGFTTINIASTAPTYSNGGAVNITAAATFGGVTMVQPGGANTTAIKASTASGWRITGVHYTSAAQAGYFVYTDTYGLIDQCYIDGGSGGDEWIVTRGPSDAWTTPATLGTASAVYVEDCTLYDQGYNDFNSNAKGVIRFCTITPVSNYVKLDSHGYSTNTPPQSVRGSEYYHNTWTTAGSIGPEVRGGGGVVFNNQTAGTPAFYLRDYGYDTDLTNWGVYQTPLNYPLFQQIGAGQMQTINATALVAYQRAQILTAGSTDYTAIGAANNNVGTQFTATGVGSGSGTVLVTVITEPMYVWGNKQSGGSAPWPRTAAAVNAAAITLYRAQTSNPSATFDESDIIQANREFYADAGFDADGTGVTVGTAAQMALASPTNKHGFWVTDEGSWNTTLPANTSGRLYVGNGSSWVLAYTPYTYPHPLRGDNFNVTVNTFNVGTLNIGAP